MKAIDYFEKYKERLLNMDLTDQQFAELAYEITMEMLLEVKQYAKNNGHLIRLLKEQNHKWNRIDVFIQKENHCGEWLRKDGFRELVINHVMPELKGRL